MKGIKVHLCVHLLACKLLLEAPQLVEVIGLQPLKSTPQFGITNDA